MDLIIESFKTQRPYAELKELLVNWDHEAKTHLFLDLAILHKSMDGVKLIGDLMGSKAYLTTYDEYNRVTPIYISQLLSKLYPDYGSLSNYMLTRVEEDKPWNRRKVFLFVLRFGNTSANKLPKGLVRELVSEYL